MAHTIPFEILVATMFRSDFTFLEMMFPHESYWQYPILIINQTDEERQLVSEHDNIRVINTSERGLSRSRNKALENARGEVCLLADDDVIYVKDVGEIVVSAFAKAKNPSVITFQMVTGNNILYKEYPDVVTHTVKTLKKVSSVEIAICRKEIEKLGIRFNTHFGLGTLFPVAEEYIFLREILDCGGQCFFEPKILLQHSEKSSGQYPVKDEIIFARGALRYKFMGGLAYVSMIKYAWFYYRKGDIRFTEIPSKIAKGFAGIKKYKNLS